MKGEGGNKEWKERRKGGRKKGRQGKEERREWLREGDEMVKGKEGWSGRKLGIGKREGEVERKGSEASYLSLLCNTCIHTCNMKCILWDF